MEEKVQETKQQQPVIPIGYVINHWENSFRGSFNEELYIALCRAKEQA